MKLDELKSELKEKEEGCGKGRCGRHIHVRVRHPMNYWQGIDKPNVVMTTGVEDKIILCPTCQAKIEYLKKGISACEEILNSQQNGKKVVSAIETADNYAPSSNLASADTQTLQTNGSLDCCSRQEIEENKKKFLICSICNNTGYLCPRTKEQRKDYEEGYKQALSQRNQEIKVKLENYELLTKWEWNDGEIYVPLRWIKRLTNSEEKA